jgi:hypothetical protein
MERLYECPVCHVVSTCICLMLPCSHILCLNCAIHPLWKPSLVPVGPLHASMETYPHHILAVEDALWPDACSVCRATLPLYEADAYARLPPRCALTRFVCPPGHADKRRAYYALADKIERYERMAGMSASPWETPLPVVPTVLPRRVPGALASTISQHDTDLEAAQSFEITFPCKICDGAISWHFSDPLHKAVCDHLAFLRCKNTPSPFFVCNVCPFDTGAATLNSDNSDSPRQLMNNKEYYEHLQLHFEVGRLYELYSSRLARLTYRYHGCGTELPPDERLLNRTDYQNDVAHLIVLFYKHLADKVQFPLVSSFTRQLYQCMTPKLVDWFILNDKPRTVFVGYHHGRLQDLTDMTRLAAKIVMEFGNMITDNHRSVRDTKYVPLATVYNALVESTAIIEEKKQEPQPADQLTADAINAEIPPGMSRDEYILRQQDEMDRRGNAAYSDDEDDQYGVGDAEEQDESSRESENVFIPPVIDTRPAALLIPVTPARPTRVRTVPDAPRALRPVRRTRAQFMSPIGVNVALFDSIPPPPPPSLVDDEASLRASLRASPVFDYEPRD